MQLLSITVEVIGPDSMKSLDGLEFTSCAFVRIGIDGLDLLMNSNFESSVVFFSELERSLYGSGRYLIFTCACGVAEDAGWVEVGVEHQQGKVCWSFERETSYVFVFDAEQYATEVKNCRTHIESLGSEIVLEPDRVVFPCGGEESGS